MLIRLRQFDKVKVYKVAEFNLWQNFASFPKKNRELYRDDRLGTNGMEKCQLIDQFQRANKEMEHWKLPMYIIQNLN